MSNVAEVRRLAVEWAQTEAKRLRERASSPEVEQGMATAVHARPLAAAALDFLHRQAPDSGFAEASRLIFEGPYPPGAEEALERVAGILEDWVAYLEHGLADAVGPEAQARLEASTDLMEQVQQLLNDNRVHAAAPIMLTGAALEEFFRSLVITHSATVNGRPGLQAYSEALRAAGILTHQDVKDVTSWAGLRNSAAHGQFDNLSRERAVLMADGVNLFMRQKGQ